MLNQFLVCRRGSLWRFWITPPKTHRINGLKSQVLKPLTNMLWLLGGVEWYQLISSYQLDALTNLGSNSLRTFRCFLLHRQKNHYLEKKTGTFSPLVFYSSRLFLWAWNARTLTGLALFLFWLDSYRFATKISF